MKYTVSEAAGGGRTQSIFVKMLAGYLALSVFVTVLSTLTGYLLIRRYTVGEVTQELTDKASVAAEMLSRSSELTYETVHALEELTDSQVIYINAGYIARHIPGSRGEGVPGESVPGDAEFERTFIADSVDRGMAEKILTTGSVESSVRYVAMLGCRVVFAGAPVYDSVHPEKIIGALMLCRRMDAIGGVAFSTALVMAVSLSVCVLFSMGLAYFMSRRITEPISSLSRTARYIAEGHYGETAHIREGDEIGQLGGALNELSTRLGQTIFDLQNEKSKLEQILSGIGEGIVAVDQSGSILHHNNAALELLDLPSWQMRAGRIDHQRLMDMLFEAMSAGIRCEAQWENASQRSIKAVVWPFTGADQQIIGAVGLLRDVSEAERLEQLRRDYVANVSHELRTPLTGIRGMIEPLMDGYIETDEERMDCYCIIHQETLRLEKLIGEMLDMSRLQSGRIEIELEPLRLEGILEGAVRRLQGRAEPCRIHLHAECEDNLPAVMGNEDRIMQVLIILIDNALSFTPEGGDITVYARRRGSMAVVGVRDNGAGIAPGDLPYIWERFYKADKSRMRTTGTGLGLSIARLVCEHMRGTISVESEPGQGATFEFTLECAQEGLADFT